MRRLPAPPPPSSRRLTNPVVRKAAAGGAGLVLLTILYWLFFYQNLPANPLNSLETGETYEEVTGPTSNVADRLVKMVMLLASISIIASRWSLARALVKKGNLGLMMFMVLAPVSAAWSINPAATLLRFTTMAAIILVCFAISLLAFDPRRIQKVVTPPLLYILLGSLALGAIYPDRIIEIGDDLSLKNAWHGLTLSKNQFGMMASMGVVIFFNRWLAGAKGKAWSVLGTVAATMCLLLSRSNTSLLATMVGVAGMTALMRVHVVKQRFSTHVVVGIAGTVLLYQLVIQDVIPGVSYLLAPVTGLTGKDTTLSSRTFIWSVIKEHISASPILGSGYGAYWTGPYPDSPSYVFVYLMYFYPTESHNGYLEMMNDLGIPGLACVLLFLVWYMRQALQLMPYDRNQASLYLALVFEEMVLNMSESEWFSRTSSCAILLLASCLLTRALHEYRSQAPRPAPQPRARGS